MSYQPIWNGRSGYGGRRHLLRKTVLILLALAVACFAALEVYIGLHSRDVPPTGPEPGVMVIFGCQVKPWGPSVLLQDRLDAALNYLEDHPDMKIVVTGGKGDDEHQSEAQCMYDYLTAHGVEGENIYREDRARNTWQNVNYTLDLMGEVGVSEDITTGETQGLNPGGDVLLVSSGFHLARIEMLWARAGGTGTPAALAAPVSHVPTAVKMFFREPLALVKSFIFDR